MFGVFSPDELQLIHDWLRGEASADGQAYDEPALSARRTRATFRAHDRLAQHQTALSNPGQLNVLNALNDAILDVDLQPLQTELAASSSVEVQQRLLVKAMAHWMHWTPPGMYATRRFIRLAA